MFHAAIIKYRHLKMIYDFLANYHSNVGQRCEIGFISGEWYGQWCFLIALWSSQSCVFSSVGRGPIFIILTQKYWKKNFQQYEDIYGCDLQQVPVKRIYVTATFAFHHNSFEVMQLWVTLTSGNINFSCFWIRKSRTVIHPSKWT